MASLRLKPGRDKPVQSRHPWVFRGALGSIPAGIEAGDIVDLVDERGGFLARGYCNPRSQIVVRILTWDDNEAVDAAFLARRLERALAHRAPLLSKEDTNACRLVHGEADGLPGLIVDRYHDFLVVQFLTVGMERWKPTIVEVLWARLSLQGIFERSDAESRRVYEGLPAAVGVLKGEEPPQRLLILENGLRFWVDLREGQQTGFYLEQRENRALVAPYCSGGQVLDAFCYTGAFGLYARAAGAGQVVHVDTSAAALAGARANMQANGFDDANDQYLRSDVMEALRELYRGGTRFDVVILDPPKLASSQSYVDRASRSYKETNLRALQLLRPGGMLATFSSSGAVSPALFRRILLSAALEAHRDVQVVARCGQAMDHPALLTFPESEYLKGLVCRVT